MSRLLGKWLIIHDPDFSQFTLGYVLAAISDQHVLVRIVAPDDEIPNYQRVMALSELNECVFIFDDKPELDAFIAWLTSEGDDDGGNKLVHLIPKTSVEDAVDGAP